MHLLDNAVFAVLASPVIYHWVVANPKLETNSIFEILSAPRVEKPPRPWETSCFAGSFSLLRAGAILNVRYPWGRHRI